MKKCLLSFTIGFAAASIALLGAYFAAKKVEAYRLPTGAPTARPSGEGWVDLFDAQHAAQWKNVDDDTKIFELKDGEFHVFPIGPMRHIAYMGEEFGDFELHLEFKLAKGANSGVFVRSAAKNPVYQGFEVQVLDDAGSLPNKNGSGAIYDVVTPMFNMARPAGEWNSYDITCRGTSMVVVVNGWKVLDVDLSKLTMPVGKFDTPLATLPPKGHILIQNHGGEAWYKNVVVRKL
jgi:hypothetical protein